MSNLYNLLKTIIEKLNATVKSVNELPQSDWNQNDETAHGYVKNRPFYTGDPVETVLVEESTVTFADTGYNFYAAEFPSTFEATVGETYKVSWDGTVYECTCVKFDNGQAIGNLSVVGAGSDTGEPFLIGIANGERIEIATADTSASHTFSISAKVAPVVKIDDKYLAISETIDLSSLSEWTGEQKQNLYDKFKSGKILLAKNIPYVEGLLTITYVNYDNMFSEFEINAIGGNYACKSYGSSWDIFELSNSNVQNRINNTLDSKTSWNLYSANATHVDIGEPFRIQLQCIEGKPVFYFQLRGNPGVDMRYKYPFLQKDTELEIGSSTGSSSKVFKITVDDSGIIKTTNTSDSTEVQFAKTSDVPTDDHINELINNAVPTALSDLSDDETHRIVTDAEKEAWNAKSDFSGSWNDLTDKPNKPFRPDGESYLTFRSLSSFKSKSFYGDTKGWDGTLEYFTSDRTWTAWDGRSISSIVDDNGEYVLYLRGTGNTVITGNNRNNSWGFYGSDIKCIGNIENLLDYTTVKSGGHPTMAANCYANMFEGCTALTQAPDLPATTLTNGCYHNMFQGCTSLTKAPALPATTLANDCYYDMFNGCASLTQAPALPATTLTNHCYYDMFYNCTSLAKAPDLPATTLANDCYGYMFHGCVSLTQIPALPATTLADSCYEGMFEGCTSLKLSSTRTDEYIQEYRIPSSGIGADVTGAFYFMFSSTGGTFKGNPSINTTYYLSSDNMIVRETDIATLNGYVGSMINNAVPTVPTNVSAFTNDEGYLTLATLPKYEGVVE